MSEKVKVSKEQADLILSFIEDFNMNFNHMHLGTFVEALENGYEVEEEFGIGDWIFSKYNKDIGRVTEVGSSYLKYDDGFISNELHAFRHATEQEIAQEKKHRFWSGIGRDVDEYREGDAIMVYDSDHWRMQYVDTVVENVEIVDLAGMVWEPENVRLRHPVEQRLDQ